MRAGGRQDRCACDGERSMWQVKRVVRVVGEAEQADEALCLGLLIMSGLAL